MSIEGVEEQQQQDTVIHISSLKKYEDMITIFRGALQLQYNLIPLFQKLSKPFLLEQYVSIDIIATLIQKVVKDTKLSPSLKKYILEQIAAEIYNFIFFSNLYNGLILWIRIWIIILKLICSIFIIKTY